MLISKLKGGLGNQMFIYTFIYMLGKRYSTDFSFDISDYNMGIGRNLELDKFNLILNETKTHSLKKFKRISKFSFIEKIKIKLKINTFIKNVINEQKFNMIDFDDIYNHEKNYYFDGYWQNINYYLQNEKILNNKFKVLNINLSKNYKLIEKQILNNENIACLHIRKGDYLNPNNSIIYQNINVDFYIKAIQIIKTLSNNIKIYVFSDDYKWVKNNMNIENSILMSKFNLNSLEEFSLMSQFKNIIISNSTFSLWASILNNNKNKLIICPKNWYCENNENKTQNLFTKNMMVLEN